MPCCSAPAPSPRPASRHCHLAEHNNRSGTSLAVGTIDSARGLADRTRDGFVVRHRDQIVAAILFPGFLVVSGSAGQLLSVAGRRDARGIQPEVHEIVLRGLRAPLPEREVVLARATLVAVALDP